MSRLPIYSTQPLPQEEAVQMDLESRRTLLRELTGNQCQCGKPKTHGQTFCKACYYILPLVLQAQLRRKMGKGYEEAYQRACTWLDVTRTR